MPEKPLQPLIPLEELKEAVKSLLGVKKTDLDKVEAERPKKERSQSNVCSRKT